MAEKGWQRIRYMPCTPLYGAERVTGGDAHRELSRRAAREGAVLLKNDGAILPLVDGAPVAVFGKAQADYVKGGGGSGDVTVAHVSSLLEGLEKKEAEGKVRLFAPLSSFYRENVRMQYAGGAHPGKTVEPALPDELLRKARAFSDTALVTLCRYSAEAGDRTASAFDGDYHLSREETALLHQVRNAFGRIAVVLNTGGMMDTSWFESDSRIGAALLAWQGGMEGGLAAAEILCGDECPSGRLTDTLARDFTAYPSSERFGESDGYAEYEEDIYVGYRYFETIPGAAEKVCYPFGFGLSYTTFEISRLEGSEAGGEIVLSAEVKNVGKIAGREVVQAYCQAPQGRLGKPARILVGFAKTKKLLPGWSERVSIRFAPEAFASYDDVGLVQASARVLEAGEYTFHVGKNVRDTQRAPFVYTVSQTRVVRRLAPRCVPHDLKRRMRADGSFEPLPDNGPSVPPDDSVYPVRHQPPVERNWQAADWKEDAQRPPQLSEVLEGKMTLDDFAASLSDEEMVHMLGGQPNRGCANTYGLGNLPERGVPNVMTADGPAGLRIRPECGVRTTAFPCATMLCCTWDEELLYAVGRAGAEEVKENGFGVWLTPAVNIHRSPLCGRNFEYYSEDPLLAGKMASAMIRGIQSMGIAASLKHFACNEKETNRRDSDSRVSERALREIYLKPFEICLREAKPWTVMSAYNLLNGTRASENADLLMGILREEWGFDGVVLSDWYTHGEQHREIAAGNDVKMGRGLPEYTLRMMREGKLSREQAQASVKRLLATLLRLA